MGNKSKSAGGGNPKDGCTALAAVPPAAEHTLMVQNWDWYPQVRDCCVLLKKKPQRASAANYLIGHAEGEAVDLEAAPDALNVMFPEKGIIVAKGPPCEHEYVDLVEEKTLN